MERISAVARDCSAQPHRCYVLTIACIVCLGLGSHSWGADPARPRGKASRPQRRAAQTQEIEEDGVQPADASGSIETRREGAQAANPENPSTSNTAVVDQLPPNVHPKHPLVPALKMAYTSRATLRNVRDYTAHFVKKELIRTDRGSRYITHSMDMKFREQPFSVYLKFRDPHEGRQVLYVKGANNGQILVQEAGIKSLVGTIAINPTDPMALSENRHPITEIGISKMLDAVIKQWEAETQYGEIDVKYHPDAKLGDFPVRVIRTTHPTRRRQFNFHITQLYLDAQTLFPVRVEQFDWPQSEGELPAQVELYMYSSVRTNQGFSDQTFDPRQYRLR